MPLERSNDRAKKRAGYELYRIQQGLEPTDWKPMPSVGASVREIRIHTDREHRVIYVAKFEEGIYVLHAFEKKSRKTKRGEIDLARQRLRQFAGRAGRLGRARGGQQ